MACSWGLSLLIHAGAAAAISLTYYSSAELLPVRPGRASVDSTERHAGPSSGAAVLSSEMAFERGEMTTPAIELPPPIAMPTHDLVVTKTRRHRVEIASSDIRGSRAEVDEPSPEIVRSIDKDLRSPRRHTNDPPDPAILAAAPPPRTTLRDDSVVQDPAELSSAAGGDGKDAVNSIGSTASAGAADGPPGAQFNPPPIYPARLLAARIGGRVVLRVRVSVKGVVVSATVLRSSGHEEFDKAALSAVRRWRFQPARRGGRAIEEEVAVPVRFVIKGTR